MSKELCPECRQDCIGYQPEAGCWYCWNCCRSFDGVLNEVPQPSPTLARVQALVKSLTEQADKLTFYGAADRFRDTLAQLAAALEQPKGE